MKKLLLISMLFSTLSFSSELKDGTYSVQGKSKFGWRSITSITVKNGKISNIYADQINKKGIKLSQTKKKPESVHVFYWYAPQWLLKGDKKRVDSYAGATSSKREFYKMVNFLREKAKVGKTGNFIYK